MLVPVRLSETVSTDRDRAGELFRGTLAAPIIANGFVIAAAGAMVYGDVVKAHRGLFLGRKSDLELTLNRITTTDRQVISVQTFPWDEKSSRNGLFAGLKMATGAAVGAVSGALTGAARGAGFTSDTGSPRPEIDSRRNLVLPAGTQLHFTLAAPVTITERLNFQ